jgi:hypothetical protein
MFSVHEINRFIEDKKRQKFAVFEKLFDQCQKHILKYATNEKYRCFFTVPEFIIGLPLYNLNAAILYIIDKLHTKGFLVKYYHPNILYICWDYDEINGKKVKTLPSPAIHLPPPRLQLSSPSSQQHFPPMPIQTRVINKPDQGSIVMPQIPQYDIPLPQSSHNGNKKNSNFIKSISEYRPSGKFALDL